MANIAKNSHRSRLAQNNADRSAPAGFPHHPGDFSAQAQFSMKPATRQEYLRKHWEFLPPEARFVANHLSTSFRGVGIQTDGQFLLGGI
jgi:hypothetical protein